MRVPLMVLALAGATGGLAQTYSSGSNGSDGALNLNLAQPGVIEFDLSDPNSPLFGSLDSDKDNVLHFTTINIGANVTLRMRAGKLRSKPVVWLATGNVVIDGTIDLSGSQGSNSLSGLAGRAPSEPGPGGYPGGIAGYVSTVGYPPTAGTGPGGGVAAVQNNLGGNAVGGGAGHARAGSCYAPGARTYGSITLVPLVGGSGGGGGYMTQFGGGGGAGGGGLRIASSTSITVNGTILAKGGDGGLGPPNDTGDGGSGSGGAIHLVANQILGSGALNVSGGLTSDFACNGSAGRIRLDAYTNSFAGTFVPNDTVSVSAGSPYPIPPPTTQPMIRITKIGGVAVPLSPTGSVATPDVTINSTSPQTVEIEAMNVPVGTVVKLQVVSESGTDQLIDSTPLSGTLALSTATAQVTLPTGYSRSFVRVVWATP